MIFNISSPHHLGLSWGVASKLCSYTQTINTSLVTRLLPQLALFNVSLQRNHYNCIESCLHQWKLYNCCSWLLIKVKPGSMISFNNLFTCLVVPIERTKPTVSNYTGKPITHGFACAALSTANQYHLRSVVINSVSCYGCDSLIVNTYIF